MFITVRPPVAVASDDRETLVQRLDVVGHTVLAVAVLAVHLELPVEMQIERGSGDPGSNADGVGCTALGPNLPTNEETLSLIEAIGGADAGLADPMMPEPCSVDPLPPGIAPKRQEELTIAAVFPYLQIQFAVDAETRASACRFLTETLPATAPELTYQ